MRSVRNGVLGIVVCLVACSSLWALCPLCKFDDHDGVGEYCDVFQSGAILCVTLGQDCYQEGYCSKESQPEPPPSCPCGDTLGFDGKGDPWDCSLDCLIADFQVIWDIAPNGSDPFANFPVSIPSQDPVIIRREIATLVGIAESSVTVGGNVVRVYGAGADVGKAGVLLNGNGILVERSLDGATADVDACSFQDGRAPSRIESVVGADEGDTVLVPTWIDGKPVVISVHGERFIQDEFLRRGLAVQRDFRAAVEALDPSASPYVLSPASATSACRSVR